MIAPMLVTPRLTLRALQPGDFDAYAAMFADASTTRFIGGKPRDRATSWIKFGQSAGFWPLLGYGFWAVIRRDDDAFVGAGGFGRFDRGEPLLDGCVEAGWAMASDARGTGLAHEFMTAALAWCDTALATEVRCIVADANAPSVALAAKLGFVPLGAAAHGCDTERATIFTRPSPGEG